MRLRLLLRLLLLCLVTSNTALAQESRGTVTGTVVDQSKGVVPGATVVVTNVAMGTSVTAITNETGFFQASYLIPGLYKIAVELSGFKKLVREGVEVRVGDRIAAGARA